MESDKPWYTRIKWITINLVSSILIFLLFAFSVMLAVGIGIGGGKGSFPVWNQISLFAGLPLSIILFSLALYGLFKRKKDQKAFNVYFINFLAILTIIGSIRGLFLTPFGLFSFIALTNVGTLIGAILILLKNKIGLLIYSLSQISYIVIFILYETFGPFDLAIYVLPAVLTLLLYHAAKTNKYITTPKPH